MSKILCSTGALLEYGGDYERLEPLSRQLICDGYEFMMDRPYYEEVDAFIGKVLSDSRSQTFGYN